MELYFDKTHKLVLFANLGTFCNHNRKTSFEIVLMEEMKTAKIGHYFNNIFTRN